MESAAPEAVAATTEKETAETKSLRSRLGAFAVLLGVHLALLGSFYALAYAYPAKTRIIAARQTWECQAGKSVTITARIHYGMPSLLRSKPPEVKVLIGLQGQKPVDGETTGPASYVRVNLPVPVKPGDYKIVIEADPGGKLDIGPLKTSARLNVLAPAKSSGS